MSSSQHTSKNGWPSNLEVTALHNSYSGNNAPLSEDISLASVWRMQTPQEAGNALAGKSSAFVYRRDGHPNDMQLCSKLARMHGTEFGNLVAQGMSALSAVALTVLPKDGLVWIADELYGKSIVLFEKALSRHGVRLHKFDPTSASAAEQLVASKPHLVLVETLSNPRLRMPDFSALAEATHNGGGLLLVDNTFATPLHCRPIEFGADIVVESLGKQVNGHSDAMLGLIVCKDEQMNKDIKGTVSTFGLSSSPLDCYLTNRGLMTLPLRIQRASSNAIGLAKSLSCHHRVKHVDYPGLEAHPQHKLASTQLQGGYGWMLSMHIDADETCVEQLFARLLPEIPFAPSLGDVCTTVSHPHSTSHRGFTDQQRIDLGITIGTIRISCGLEPIEWLTDRFLGALSGL